MKKTVCCIIALLLAISLFGCGTEGYTDRVIKGKSAYVTLRMSKVSSSGKPFSGDFFNNVADGCGRLVAKCDKLMSHFGDESQIYALNNTVDMIVSPDDSLVSVLTSAINLSKQTGGAYSPAAGGLEMLWASEGTPDDEEITEALKHTDTDLLRIGKEKITRTDPLCYVDLSGISEGFGAQKLIEYLSAAEVSYGVVSFGDSVGVFGEKSDGEDFKIGIKSPEDPETTLAYLHITSGFVSVYDTSGDSTIIDPTTGHPAKSGTISVTVRSGNGATSDGLSEALMVLGEAGTAELYDAGTLSFEAVLINENGEIILTDGISEEDFELLIDGYTVRKIKREAE